MKVPQLRLPSHTISDPIIRQIVDDHTKQYQRHITDVVNAHNTLQTKYDALADAVAALQKAGS